LKLILFLLVKTDEICIRAAFEPISIAAIFIKHPLITHTAYKGELLLMFLKFAKVSISLQNKLINIKGTAISSSTFSKCFINIILA
jgi:hypothetical protein